MITIIIDNREKQLKTYFSEYENSEKYTFLYENLDLGDIIIKKNDKIILVIERKTIDDLYSSIQDGRYKEQKIRLTNIFSKNQLLYLLEGNIRTLKTKYFKNYNSIVSGALINTIYRDNIRVLRSINIEETIDFILLLSKKINKNLDFFVNINDNSNESNNINDNSNESNNESNNKSNNKSNKYENTIKLKKKDNMNPKICSILQLSQIPGVSTNIANIIIEKYESIYKLVKSYSKIEEESNRKKMLQNIEFGIKNNKTRKIGPVISEKIYTYLVNN